MRTSNQRLGILGQLAPRHARPPNVTQKCRLPVVGRPQSRIDGPSRLWPPSRRPRPTRRQRTGKQGRPAEQGEGEEGTHITTLRCSSPVHRVVCGRHPSGLAHQVVVQRVVALEVELAAAVDLMMWTQGRWGSDGARMGLGYASRA